MQAAEFIARWQMSGGRERANFQPFLIDLCDLLGVGRPEPFQADLEANRYVFEFPVQFRDAARAKLGDGHIDLYKAGHFVMEAKQGSDAPVPASRLQQGSRTRQAQGTARRGTAGWDAANEKAFYQALSYTNALPQSHGWPPFILVVDVGYSIELFSDFSGQGRFYQYFPDPRTSRILLADLARDEVRARLAAVFTDPHSLDPSQHAARVTNEVAQRLAMLARTLEGQGHAPKVVAGFLMRCLFAMFSEDADLIPEGSFERLLDDALKQPDLFVPFCEQLFADMDRPAQALDEVRRYDQGRPASRWAGVSTVKHPVTDDEIPQECRRLSA